MSVSPRSECLIRRAYRVSFAKNDFIPRLPGLLSLNDDALVQILSRLYGQDALSFSLTSKRASALGLARVGAVIQCNDCSHNLRPLHRFLLAPLCGIPRAHYLESFQLDYDHKAGLEHLVVDILVEAENLREFRMTRFDVCLSHDPRLGPAMCFIRKLTNLDLSVPNEAVCAILPSLRGSLHSVTLRYRHPYSTQQPEQQSFVSLSAVLSAHRDIHTVHICHFIPQPESLHAGPITATEEPEFHSIRSLRLQACSILALKLVEMCPNLETLDIEDGLSTPESSEDVIRHALSRSWPPLHRLAFEIHHSTDLLRHIVPHLRPTSILEINDWLSVNGSRPFTHTNSAQFYTHVNSRVPDVTLRGAHDNSSYSTLLRAAAPHALVLRLRLSHGNPAGSPLWGEITARVPQLRSLTLELEPDVLLSFELGFYGWPDGILVSTSHRVTALY